MTDSGEGLADFLAQQLVFYPDRIEVEASGDQVMMLWEKPLMQRMAQLVAAARGDVLEIGFGMGLSCDAVQQLRPRSHTIVEAHPQIAERARAWAGGRPHTRIVEGAWQDVLEELSTYDGISFDVYGGRGQRPAFLRELPHLLRPGGIATFWMGDATDVPQADAALLDTLGFGYRLTHVTALPDPRCRYSSTNRFTLPLIRHRG